MSREPENPFQSASIYQAEVVPTATSHASQEGDATGGLIPYKNPHALIAYYLGIVSLLPIIGVPFGIASIVLGFMGLSRRKANPVIKGSVHAWIGIVFGFCSLLCGGGFLIMIFIGVASEAR